MARYLVTGAVGFVGRHLLRSLATQGDAVEVVGLDRSGRWPDDCADLASRFQLMRVDLLDRPALEQVLAEVRPERVIHLAGFASPAAALRDPLAAWSGNLTATLHLFEGLVTVGLQPRVLFVGTGQVYGDVPTGTVLTEEAPLRPNNPYAASKAAADLAGWQYFATTGLPVLRVRPFNHVGPGQSADYAVANFARQLAAMERGEQGPVLETGNLSPRRDLTDVRDVVRAYLLLLEQGEAGAAYNVASGTTVTMAEVVQRLIRLSGLQVEVRSRSDLARRVDLSVPVVDTSRLREVTGWQPTISLDQTLADVLDAWRRAG